MYYPRIFVLTEVTPKQKPLKYVDGDKVLRSEERRLAFGNALTAMGGSMARQQSDDHDEQHRHHARQRIGRIERNRLVQRHKHLDNFIARLCSPSACSGNDPSAK